MLRLLNLVLVSSAALAAPAQVVINEVGIAPSAPGVEFAELYNRSGCAVDLTCYTLVYSSTTGSPNFNPTGWTVKIPAGKSIAAGGYFLIGGNSGIAGVGVGGTGYTTGGVGVSYSTADVDVGSNAITANAVFIKQGVRAGFYSNISGQLTLLDAAGSLVASVSYNNGNNAGTYPVSAYTTCLASGNTQGVDNVTNPGDAPFNTNGTFSSTTNQGIYLNASGTYQIENSLTPGASNATNGGSQICSGPVLSSAGNASVCYSALAQTTVVSVNASNGPAVYAISWDALPANTFVPVANATFTGITVSVNVPAGTAPGTYTGYLSVANDCGGSCAVPFTVTVDALPVASAGTYGTVCVNSGGVNLVGTPAGGAFTGPNVSGSVFTPPATAGTYNVAYAYTDAVTGCTNTGMSSITVAAPVATYTTACVNALPFVFFGQTINSNGLHAALLPNPNGCTDTARLYLTVLQTINTSVAGCDSVLYASTYYYGNTTLTETIQSAVTDCDSLVKNIAIAVRRSSAKDTAVCLPPGGALTMLGQTFTASGGYSLHTVNAAGCDSTIRLRLTVAAVQTIDTAGCDSVRFNGTTYFSSAQVSDTIRTVAFGCDSLIRTTSVVVHPSRHTFLSACVAPGQTYSFNGQALAATGNYTATYGGGRCDSTVHLYLLATRLDTVRLRGCRQVVYNGVTYTASVTLQETITSTVLPCDSVRRTIQIVVAQAIHDYLTACISSGQSYSFNGQTLTATGNYTAHYSSNGCDSTVHLYLLVRATTLQRVSGCDSAVHNGITYYASTVLSDTVRSAVTGCDSIIRTTNVRVHSKPSVFISGKSVVCKGDTATLIATASAGTVAWAGLGAMPTITVFPLGTTAYTATATDSNGCRASASFTVQVHDLNLKLYAAPNVALQGKPMDVQTTASLPYTVSGWQPAGLFPVQRAKAQRLMPDSSVTVTVTATSSGGCADTASVSLNVIPFDDVYVPTAFTPNGDGKNETLRVFASGLMDMRFTVYNRWGQAVFATTDKNAGWNGTVKGLLQPADVYVWTVKAKKRSGQSVERKGTAVLVR